MDIREQTVKYIKSLSIKDRLKLKQMINHNIVCCSGLVKQLKISLEDFNTELRSIFKKEI